MVFRILQRIIRAVRIRDDGSARDETPDRLNVEAVSNFPIYCLRGLRKMDWVDDRLVIDTEAFLPDPKTARTRTDGGLETSVNWEDDAQAEAFTLADHSNARYGAARLATEQIRHTSRTTAATQLPLSWERKSIPNKNPYHGNIVYASHVNKRLQKQLAAVLATKSRFLPPPRIDS
jgi:hypothetical protein